MYRIPDTPVCERGNDLIAFLYGEIDERAARDFERHLLNCAECESELSAFKQIRSSVVAWRQESLGGATANSVSVSPAVDRASDPGKPSAIAAIRQFFDLSPLWMKGSIAFASVLFCVVSVLALAHLFENPKPLVVADEKRIHREGTAGEDRRCFKIQVSRIVRLRSPHLCLLMQLTITSRIRFRDEPPTQSSERVAANPKVRRGPLTKSEREQLAADLRLIVPQDDTDLDLLGDGNNQ